MPAHKHDINNLYQVLVDFPLQFTDALNISTGVKAIGTFKRIVVAGMGGSSLPADIVNMYVRGEATLYLNRDYGVPHWADRDTLVICTSYSGDTEETIESFHDAWDRGCTLVVITSGGELKDLADKHHVPQVLLPAGLQPRCATGYIFTAILSILVNSELVGKQHVAHVREMAAALSQMQFEEQAATIAHALKGHVPIVYASEQFHTIARIWKIKINENAKIQAFHNAFPELNHNEMVGYTNLIMKPYVIFLRSDSDHERVRKRMDITKGILEKKHIPTLEIAMEGKTPLTRIFSTLLLGDWISYYLSKEYGVDPTPVELVQDFKNMMKIR